MKAVFLSCLLAFVSADALAKCGPSKWPKRAEKSAVISLTGTARGVRAAPAFYLRSGDTHVVYLAPDDVMARLRSFETDYRERGVMAAAERVRVYIDEVSRDLPLKEHTDLFKYSLRNPDYIVWMNATLRDLLDAGHASIGDAQEFGNALVPDMQDFPKITRIEQWGGSTEASRKYCTDGGAVLFSFQFLIY